ncbi:MAG TPA: hypothetical protein VI670_26990 [Thermoanaerobaculia bacterium]|jgi:hypothetical protein
MADSVPMDFTATHQKHPLGGHRISITVKAKKPLTNVRTILDGLTLDERSVDPKGTSYSQSFPQKGSFHPGSEHELIIVAKDETEFTDAHHEVWTDE